MSDLLTVRDLLVTIGDAPVVDGMNFTIRAGETVALVGESGCGKSLTARAIMGLLPPVARRRSGTIVLDGRDIAPLDEAGLAAIRGDVMSMIFQEPTASLNPLMTVGQQIIEALVTHRRREPRRRRPRRRSRCSTRSASRLRSGGCRSIRSSSPAGCASA